MKIVIIEDEQYTAQDLSDCITALRPEFEVVKVLRSVKEAVEYLKENKTYDLIFSDIQLGDGLSFDIYASVQTHVPVIFCTAYDNYAIEAFKANGIDYVLKPVDKSAIERAIEKYERLVKPIENSKMEELLKFVKNNSANKTSTSILVHHKDKVIPVKLEEIAFFYIQNEGCRIMNFQGQNFSISETLDRAEKVAGEKFFRANRQFLVNRKAVKEVEQGFSRTHTLVLNVECKEPIVISKEKAPFLFKWLAEH